jgi:hypothetical protein
MGPETLAAPGRARHPRGSMSTRARRLRGSVGQTTSEYLGVLVVIAAIVGALATGDIGKEIRTQVLCKVQEIADGKRGGCGGQTTAFRLPIDKDCVLSSSTSSANVGGTVAFIEVGAGNVLIEERLADGRTRITLLDKASAAAKALAGGKLKLGRFGGDWSAEAAAGLSLSGAQVYEFGPGQQAQAAAFRKALGNEGTFSQLVENGFRGPAVTDPGGVKDAIGDWVFGEDDIPRPPSTSTYVEGGVFGDAEATGALGIGPLSGETSAALQAAENVKVTTSGKDKGQMEGTYKLNSDVGASLLADLYGGEGSGEAGLSQQRGTEAKVTYGTRPDGSYGPTQLELKTDTNVARNAKLESEVDGQTLKQAGGYIKDLGLSGSEQTGRKLETVMTLDLSNGQVGQEVLDLVTKGAPITEGSQLIQALRNNAKATLSIYDTTSDEVKGEIAGGLGVNLGLEGGEKQETERLLDSVVAEAGKGFRRRDCGQ